MLFGKLSVDHFQCRLRRHGSKKHCRLFRARIIHPHFQTHPRRKCLYLGIPLHDLGLCFRNSLMISNQKFRHFHDLLLFHRCCFHRLLIDQLIAFQTGEHRLFLRSILIQHIQCIFRDLHPFLKA